MPVGREELKVRRMTEYNIESLMEKRKRKRKAINNSKIEGKIITFSITFFVDAEI